MRVVLLIVGTQQLPACICIYPCIQNFPCNDLCDQYCHAIKLKMRSRLEPVFVNDLERTTVL